MSNHSSKLTTVTIKYIKDGRRRYFTCDGPAIGCVRDMSARQMDDHLIHVHPIAPYEAMAIAMNTGSYSFLEEDIDDGPVPF